MATGIASVSGQLHLRKPVYWRSSYGKAQCHSNVILNGMQNQIPWSYWVSKFLRVHRSNYSQCQVKTNWKSHSGTINSCQRDGSTRYFDFAVIGSGIAGLRYALEVAKHGTVAVITKAEPHESNTNYAQGGVSAVLCPMDSVESHMQDTIVAGAYLCDEETVRVVCTEGPERIKELIAMGASFDHGEDGNLHLAREGGHSHRRIVHAADMTGREIERALLEAVFKHPNIHVFQHHFAIDLLTTQDGSDIVCHGVDTINTETQEVIRFISKVTLLASGGAGHTYPSTTNPPATTVYREACSRSQKALRRYEADLQRVTDERNSLTLLLGQREEEIKDLRAELAKAYRDQADLSEQLQQKIEMIGKLREEVDVIKTESLQWKEGMNRFDAEKETARA
uniref:L-aspartate oxidase, chloroplastic n=1 Tax=Nicotiana tabacum TaxID=4097 RepID=A0A1S4A387_TOBAC|nr:PREDICTED: L-aspartate oxidase, chloroplastic-like [Nicotiana tabacum]